MNGAHLYLVLIFVASTKCQDDIGNEDCYCDLTMNICDINCCCDKECQPNELDLFTECLSQPVPLDHKYCFHKNHMQLNNSPIAGNTFYDAGGLLCIYHDNYPQRFEYQVPAVPVDQQKFTAILEANADLERLSEVNPLFEAVWPLARPLSKWYRVGDPIVTLTNEQTLALFSLPVTFLGDTCDGEAPVNLLQDTTTTCQFVMSQKTCESNRFLSAKYFAKDKFNRILKTPRPLSGNSDLVVTPGLFLQLLFEESVEIELSQLPSAPVWNQAENRCDNHLASLAFEIRVNGTGGISSVKVQSTSQSSVSDTVTQVKYSMLYKWTETPDEYGSDVRRSGAPGYRFGEAVLAGELTDNDPQDQGGFGILVAQDNQRWMTVPSVSIACANNRLDKTSPKTSIVFGHSLLTGCQLQFPSQITVSLCDQLQQAAIDHYDYALDERVAIYANASVNLVGDWLPVLTRNPPQLVPKPDPAVSGCPLTVRLDIVILYAFTGDRSNPQAKIIGVERAFTTKSVKFQCLGPSCVGDLPSGQYDRSQPLSLMTAVSFLDVSRPTEEAVSLMPTIEVSLPSDFFYPFTGYPSKADRTGTGSRMVLSLVIVKVIWSVL